MKKFFRIASLDIDVQSGFSEICPKELPVPGALEIVNALNEQAKFASVRVGSKDAHPSGGFWTVGKAYEETKEFQNVDKFWPEHCVAGTLGFTSLPGIPALSKYDYFVFKGCDQFFHPYGACYHDLSERVSTGLIEYLQCNEIDLVLIGGLALDYCVKTTAIQLKDAGFMVIVNLEACRGVSQDTITKAIIEMTTRKILIVKDTDQAKKVCGAFKDYFISIGGEL